MTTAYFQQDIPQSKDVLDGLCDSDFESDDEMDFGSGFEGIAQKMSVDKDDDEMTAENSEFTSSTGRTQKTSSMEAKRGSIESDIFLPEFESPCADLDQDSMDLDYFSPEAKESQ